MNSAIGTKVEAEKKPSQLLVYLFRFFNYVIFLIFLIVLASGYLFVLKPKYDQIKKEITAKLEKYQTTKGDLEDYQINLLKYSSSFKQIDLGNQEKVNLMINDNILPEYIFDEISDVIASKNIILNSITIDSTDSDNSKSKIKSAVNLGSDVQILRFTISLMGLDYQSFKNLLSALEDSIKMYDVMNVSFSPADGTAVLQIQKYYLKN